MKSGLLLLPLSIWRERVPALPLSYLSQEFSRSNKSLLLSRGAELRASWAGPGTLRADSVIHNAYGDEGFECTGGRMFASFQQSEWPSTMSSKCVGGSCHGYEILLEPAEGSA